jgi:hypothetical protein
MKRGGGGLEIDLPNVSDMMCRPVAAWRKKKKKHCSSASRQLGRHITAPSNTKTGPMQLYLNQLWLLFLLRYHLCKT